ncbi:MAG: MATE family efflux transporter [Clostridiales bacterium]|nr:MATE family efflux transporter [Clostridiales bacterium]
MFKKLIGTKDFYKKIISLMVPIMIQNGIMQFVNMLDNIMVGRLGTVEMSGVSIANQLIFVFNLCIFGAVSGAGIFGAQYAGKKDDEGVRFTFRFKLIFCFLISVIGILIFLLFNQPLLSAYLTGEGSPEDAILTLGYAKEYLFIMLIGLIPASLVQGYSSTLRETGKPKVPMYAGIVAVLVNLVLNYVLIFGQFGAPRLGVKGAAIATVTSRFVELIFIALWTKLHESENRFIIGAYKSMYVPIKLIKQIALKGIPLMLNETLWAAGMAFLTQRYSVRGLDVVAGVNISSTFFNVFSVAFMAVGAAIGIILGQLLGANKTNEAHEASYKLIAFSVFISLVVASAYFICANFIPSVYETTDTVKSLATDLMKITAIAMPVDAFANATYFTLRSGGKSFITFLFDSGFVWAVCVPVIFILSQFTALPILPLYFIGQMLSVLKCIIGGIFVKKGVWVKNIV